MGRMNPWAGWTHELDGPEGRMRPRVGWTLGWVIGEVTNLFEFG